MGHWRCGLAALTGASIFQHYPPRQIPDKGSRRVRERLRVGASYPPNIGVPLQSQSGRVDNSSPPSPLSELKAPMPLDRHSQTSVSGSVNALDHAKSRGAGVRSFADASQHTRARKGGPPVGGFATCQQARHRLAIPAFVGRLRIGRGFLSRGGLGCAPGGPCAADTVGSVITLLHCAPTCGALSTSPTPHLRQCPVSALKLSLTAASPVAGLGRKHLPAKLAGGCEARLTVFCPLANGGDQRNRH